MRHRAENPFGVRHHAQHAPIGAEDTGNVAARSVGIVGIAEGDATFAFERIQRGLIGEVIAVVMRDRNADLLIRLETRGEDRLRVRDLKLNRLADKALTRIAHKSAGQQAALGQHLKAVANPKNITAAFGMTDHRLTNRRLGRNRPAAQIIPEREPARHRHQINIFGQR